LLVLTRPSKLTRASSVSESTIGDTLLRFSGCLAVLNERDREYISCSCQGSNHQPTNGRHTWRDRTWHYGHKW
jgi:hypothetical protein